jgi:hypothetical protein
MLYFAYFDFLVSNTEATLSVMNGLCTLYIAYLGHIVQRD